MTFSDRLFFISLTTFYVYVVQFMRIGFVKIKMTSKLAWTKCIYFIAIKLD